MIRNLSGWSAVFLGLGAAGMVQASFPAPYNTEPEDGQRMSAEQAAATAEVPSGFRVEVFAAEPEVQQPIAISFDDFGRLWVAECHTFAEQPRRWDLNLCDRILVLTDQDGDGRADERTVFWAEGKRLTSLAVGCGGVYVLCAPNLLFIPDVDGDLVPDSEPQVLLEGFDAEQIGHNVVNGLKWGPDGWLYGRHGITTTSLVGTPDTPEGRRTPLNCSIWRFHPVTQAFEVYCHGGTNPWGMDWDANGQLFYTNTVIGHLWHAIPGAYYQRMFGAHLNQRVVEVIPHTADHYHWDTGAEVWNDIRQGLSPSTDELGGGHAHTGCLIYQGGVWPAAYQGKLFTLNYHGRRLNMEHLEREGVGYVARHAPDFLRMKDPWFRGLDVVNGPDGQVWINDWSDTGECHDNDGIHRTSGRIYRVVYAGEDAGDPTPARPPWLATAPGDAIPKERVESLLLSGEEACVAMGVRWLAHGWGEQRETAERLIAVAKAAPAGLVRLELGAALQRLPNHARFRLAEVLCAVAEDADDRQQPLMLWYGISDAVVEDTEAAIQLAMASRLPTVTRLVARRLAETMDAAPVPVDRLLSESLRPEGLTRLGLILQGMGEGLAGWSEAPKPSSWDAVSAAVRETGDGDAQKLVQSLSVLFGDGRARDDLMVIAADRDEEPGARRAALLSLLRQPTDALLPLLQKLVNDKVLAVEAVRGLASFDVPDTPKRLLTLHEKMGIAGAVVIDTLVSRSSYAHALLDAVEEGRVSPSAISPFQARQIQSLDDEMLGERLRLLWGELGNTTEDKLAEIAVWKEKLTGEGLRAADVANGRVVFAQTCGGCHRLYGEGGALGPDLTGSDRQNLDYLLGNIVHPNEVVPVDYRLAIFTLKDGRVVSGVVPEENDRAVTVQGPAERHTFEKSDIERRESLPLSLMPEGLLNAMDEKAVRDLMAYLMSTGR